MDRAGGPYAKDKDKHPVISPAVGIETKQNRVTVKQGKTELINTGNKLVVTRAWGVDVGGGEMGEGCQKVHIPTAQVSGGGVQHGCSHHSAVRVWKLLERRSRKSSAREENKC